MIRRVAMGVAGAVVLCAANAHADEARCISARYIAAGKYASCETKTHSFDLAYLRCRQKYARRWTTLGKKYPGTSCEGARFTDNGDTITDNLTQLVWEKKTTVIDSGANPSDRHDVDNVYSWSAASPNADGTAFTDFLDDLNSTGFAGQHDWRLPTLFELQSILSTDATNNPCVLGPCVADPLFLPTQSAFYWASTNPRDPSGAWIVDFLHQFTNSGFKTTSNYVRAVRGGLF